MTDKKELPKGDIVFFDGRGDAVDGYSAAKVREMVDALQTALETQAKEIERLTLRLKMTSDTMNSYMLERDQLQAKLDAAQAQEPVAWLKYHAGISHLTSSWQIAERDEYTVPLYASPVVQQALTDERILTLWVGDTPRPVMGKNKVLTFARAIEAAHGIGGQQP